MEIKKIQKEINQKIKKIGLTPKEKSSMLERIYNSPISTPSPYIFFCKLLPSRWKFSASKSFVYISVSMIFLISTGGAMAYSSLGAVPGDSLYAVKVRVVEPMLDSLTFSAFSQAKLEADRAIRRLDEADKLLSKNNLTSEYRAEIETRFKQDADNFNMRIESIKNNSSNKTNKQDTDEAENLRVNFEKSLNSHAENLRINGEKPENMKQKQEVDLLENTVRGRTSSNNGSSKNDSKDNNNLKGFENKD